MNIDLLVKKKELSKIFDVSLTTIDKWVNKDCPIKEKLKNGRIKSFYLPDVIKWREGYRRETKSDEDLDLQEERARLAKEQADGQAIKNSVSRREILPTKLLEFALASMSEQVSSILASIPLKVKKRVPKLTSSEIEVIKREIVKAQNAASKSELDYDRAEEVLKQIH